MNGPRSPQHVMLLYNDDDARNKASINYINEALARGAFTIYASVNAHEPSFMSILQQNIVNYSQHVTSGNLLIVRFKTFYEHALQNNLEPFKDLKVILEEILSQRIADGRNTEVLAVADCADNLSRNEMFDECVYVERWWQETHNEWLKAGHKITVICPHPSKVLETKPLAHRKSQISGLHGLTLSLPGR